MLPRRPCLRKKETEAHLINIEESEIESPQHRNICSTNIVEPAYVSGRKLAGKEIDSIVDINNSASTSNITTKSKINVNQNVTDHAIKGYKMFCKNCSMHIPNVNTVTRKNACIYFKKTLQEEGCHKNFTQNMCLNHSIFKSFYTSKTTNENLIDLNLRSVHAAVTSGGGLTSLRSFCSSMDLPPPVHTAPYSKYLKVILKSTVETCDESMNCAAQSLSNNEVLPTEVTVSIDGTWQKRYGQNSLLGATFVISIYNGCVLDYSIKCRTRTVCKKNPNLSEEWKKSHEPFCHIN